MIFDRKGTLLKATHFPSFRSEFPAASGYVSWTSKMLDPAHTEDR